MPDANQVNANPGGGSPKGGELTFEQAVKNLREAGAYDKLGLLPSCNDAEVAKRQVEVLQLLTSNIYKDFDRDAALVNRTAALIKERNRVVASGTDVREYPEIKQCDSAKEKAAAARTIYTNLFKLLNRLEGQDQPPADKRDNQMRGILTALQRFAVEQQLQGEVLPPSPAPRPAAAASPASRKPGVPDASSVIASTDLPQAEATKQNTAPAPATMTTATYLEKVYSTGKPVTEDNLTPEHNRIRRLWNSWAKIFYVAQYPAAAAAAAWLAFFPGEFLSGVFYRSGSQGLQLGAATAAALGGGWIFRKLCQKCFARGVFDALNAFQAGYHNFPDMRSATMMVCERNGTYLDTKRHYRAISVLTQMAYPHPELKAEIDRNEDAKVLLGDIQTTCDKLLKRVLSTLPPGKGRGPGRIFPLGMDDPDLKEAQSLAQVNTPNGKKGLILKMLEDAGINLAELEPIPHRYSKRLPLWQYFFRSPSDDNRVLFKAGALGLEQSCWWEREELGSGKQASVNAVRTITQQLAEIIEKGEKKFAADIFQYRYPLTTAAMYYGTWVAAGSLGWGLFQAFLRAF